MSAGMLAPVAAADDPRSAVCLLDVDGTFAAAVPADDAAARKMLQLRTLRLARGAWEPPQGIGRVLGLLVVDGLVLREHRGRGHVSILGPGDLADVRRLAEGDEGWRVIRPATVAIVDARLLLAGRQWPRLFAALTHRLFDLADEQAALNAMLGLPRVENRLTVLFDHYAGRWGRAVPGGRLLDLPLTHELLGRLVGARRPTVSLALAMLADQGRVLRDADGAWLLPDATGDGRAEDAQAQAVGLAASA